MKKHLITAFLMTIATTILLGVIYPLLITALAQLFFKGKANGQIRYRNGEAVGSRIIAQPFVSAKYFHSRPSNAGNGYDAANSGGTNLASTNQKLIDRVKASVAKFHKENPGYTGSLPADLVTTSGSGLDPHISPASALAQLDRVANARGVPVDQIKSLIDTHTEGRDFGFLGEPRVNVLLLNLDLDQAAPAPR